MNKCDRGRCETIFVGRERQNWRLKLRSNTENRAKFPLVGCSFCDRGVVATEL